MARRTQHDHSYRLLFSQPEMVADLLRGFVDQAWVDSLNMETLEPVKTDFITRQLQERRADCLWRVRWQGADSWLYIYLLLEFQSRPDHWMPLRMLTYVSLLYQMLVQSGCLGRSDKLPPVLPIVLYNGEPTWQAARELSPLLEDPPEGLALYQPNMRYLLIDESDYKHDPLPETRNLVSALFRLEHSQTAEDIRSVLDALVEWVSSPEQREIKQAFAAWMQKVLLPARLPGVELKEMQGLDEVQNMLEERVRRWTKDWKQQGLEEGRLLGERLMLQRQLVRRFGELDADTLQRIEQAGEADLQKWADSILDARTLDEVFH